MGYLKSVGTSIIYIGAYLAIITFIPGIPPTSKFTEYSIAPPKKLTNDLAVNGRLNDAEILFQHDLKGPEAFASYNGELYTGIHGGYLVKVTDTKIIPIVKFGIECDGLWEEAKCGRILGIKFDKKGALYVCDAYYGIFKVDVKTGKYERLVNAAQPIEGKQPMIFNSLDIASNGDIYWSDSSTEYPLQDGLYAGLTNPSGRLIRYDAATKINHVLVHDLAFANGVALSKNEDFVIVAETLASRIIKYNLKGPKAGKREIFIEGLPGLPDNIDFDNTGGYFINLVIHVDEERPLLLQSLQPHPYIRQMLARLLTLVEAPFKFFNLYYPNYYTQKIIHYLGGFESTMFLSSNIVTVLRIDNNGKIIDAAYSSDGKISGVSTAYVHKGYLWLGSPFVEFIAKVPLNQAFPSLLSEKNKQSEEIEKKNTIKKERSPSSTTKTPKPVDSKSNVPTPKPVESKPYQNTKPVESKSSSNPGSKTSSNQQKSSQSNGRNSHKE